MRFVVLSRLLALTALLLAAQVASAANSVRSVSLDAPTADGARLQLQLATAPRHEVSALDKPRRIVIDLKGTVLAKGLRLPPAAGPVRAMRSSVRPDGTTLRVVMELDRNLDPKVAVNGTQLTIELGTLPSSQAAPTSPVPVRPEHAPADAGRDIVVAIDAGHGGEDPGASGTRTREKDVTLAIARALAKLVNAEPGMRAYLVRDSDIKIPLPQRVELARRARADIFISVHADAHPNRQISGSSVYVLSERGASDDAASWLADSQNAVDGNTSAVTNSALASVLIDVSQTASITSSMEAAGHLLGELDQVGTIRKSQVQQAGFRVLKSRDIPSVLVETGYITNSAEEQKLRTAGHQAQVAAAIFKGVREYFRQRPPDGTLFARQRAASRAAPTVLADSASP